MSMASPTGIFMSWMSGASGVQAVNRQGPAAEVEQHGKRRLRLVGGEGGRWGKALLRRNFIHTQVCCGQVTVFVLVGEIDGVEDGVRLRDLVGDALGRRCFIAADRQDLSDRLDRQPSHRRVIFLDLVDPVRVGAPHDVAVGIAEDVVSEAPPADANDHGLRRLVQAS
jgi:hypothetical protein